MAASHQLFLADSHAILKNTTAAGRREISLTLCGLLLRGAGLEWYERGDLWHRVSHERPLPRDVAAENIHDLAATMRTLMLGAPAEPAALGQRDLVAWAVAFHSTGRELRRLADHGALERGLRAVLSYHVIFHWNRMGLPARTQAILAHAARAAILDTEPDPVPAAPNPTLPADALATTTAAFPLIREPRLHAADLTSRIDEAATFADRLAADAPAEKQIENACTVWNLAALIYADCGLTQRAVELCETQFEIFHAAWPVSGRIAIASLQPLINLIRLTRRGGDPRAAHQALVALDHAVHHAGSTTITRRTINFASFTDRPGGLGKATPWLRTVLLEDGTRALMAAHDWTAAAEHAAIYDSRPELLREARQTRIIALAHNGHAKEALAVLAATELSQPWEHAVAACLRNLIHQLVDPPKPYDVSALFAAVQLARANPDRSTTSFRTRLTLTALRLATPNAPGDAAQLAAGVAEDIITFDNALCARDTLASPAACERMTASHIASLESLTARAYLKAGAMPAPYDRRLIHILDETGPALARALAESTRGSIAAATSSGESRAPWREARRQL